MDLDEVVKLYQVKFRNVKYELPKFWMEREKYGLVKADSDMPLFSRLANLVVMNFQTESFPWGYVYGFLDIDDPDKKDINGAESIIQMVMMNLSTFLPACFIFLSALFVPIVMIVIFAMRQRGLCGASIKIFDLFAQKKTGKFINCASVVLFGLLILVSAVEFCNNALPITETLPDVIQQIVVRGINDFGKFFTSGVEQLKYALKQGLIEMVDASIVTLTKHFANLITTILSELEFDLWQNMTAALEDSINEFMVARNLIQETSAIAVPIRLSMMAVSTNLVFLKSQLRNLRVSCNVTGVIVKGDTCGLLVPADAIPDPPPSLKLSYDPNTLIKSIDGMELDKIISGLGDFNTSLIVNLSNRSIPIDEIRDKLKGNLIGVADTLDLGNPLKNRHLEELDRIVKYMASHQFLTIASSTVRFMSVAPVVYVLFILVGISLGIQATRNERFPCPYRNKAADLGASTLNFAQSILIPFYSFFAVVAGGLVTVMAIASIASYSIYTRDIITRVADRIPDHILNRTLAINFGSTISTRIIFDRLLRTCEHDGGGLEALGFNVGHFRRLTDILETVKWPDVSSFRDKLDENLYIMDELVVPRHGSVSSLHDKVKAVTLPSVPFDQLIQQTRLLESIILDGETLLLLDVAKNLKNASAALVFQKTGASARLASDYAAAALTIDNIIEDSYRMQQYLGILKPLYPKIDVQISKAKSKIYPVFPLFSLLGKKIQTLGQNYIKKIELDYQLILNKVKLGFRKSIFTIADFFLGNLFRCRIVYDVYDVIAELLYRHIIGYLNGLCLSSLGICAWFFASFRCWAVSEFFLPVAEYVIVKKTRKELEQELLEDDGTYDYKEGNLKDEASNDKFNSNPADEISHKGKLAVPGH